MSYMALYRKFRPTRFSEVKGQEATKVEGVTAKLSTESSYGDYELDLDGLPEEITSDNVNAVVVKTTDGTAYGMRHLENIWLGTKLAWSTGFTSQVHGCPTSSGHYKSMMGKTIDSIEYYTTNGVYTMDIADIYVPVKSEITKVKVADADITAGKTKINVQLPDEFKPEYSVDGLDVSVEGKVLTFKAATESRAAASVKPGKYTLTIKDKNKKYADVVTTFTLTTKDMPAAYDEENKKLVEAKGFDTDALKAYLGNITSVNVNGKDYAASGRGSVVIINKDGTIKTDADPFKDAVAGTEFQITVASTGYTTPLTFTYKIAETPAPAEVDTTALEAAIAEADNLKEADYTAESWSVYQAALQSARTALEAKESQDAVDQALAALNAAKDALVKAEEEPVAINTASLEKAIADAKALKEADYTADSWKALQSALSDAQKALEAKEHKMTDDQIEAIGAGDQGMMFGFATNETEEYMPYPIALAHKLARQLTKIRKDGTLPYLRPDGKTQVTVEYDENGKPARLDAVVLSTQHDPDVTQEQIHEDIKKHVFDAILPQELVDENTKFFVNPTGRFVIGGPHGDSGLTGRKIIVDTYGGYARHGGGAFSGKDCTKVDRSAAYAARYAAKNIVAAGLADKCEIQLSYAIGVAQPTSVMVDTFGTGKLSDEKITEIVRENFDLRPAGIIKMLDLRRPIYKQTAAYGHFGRNDLDLPWEKLDKVDALKKYL